LSPDDQRRELQTLGFTDAQCIHYLSADVIRVSEGRADWQHSKYTYLDLNKNIGDVFVHKKICSPTPSQSSEFVALLVELPRIDLNFSATV
jgi:hypothetical protein